MTIKEIIGTNKKILIFLLFYYKYWWILNDSKKKVKYIIPELEEFLDKVDTKQLQVLRKFHKKAGTNLSAKSVRGSGKGGQRLHSPSVEVMQ